jgi:pyridoxal phosphate enzyme (YggS family)
MNIISIKEKIRAVEQKYDRIVGSTTLIAVSKKQPLQRIEAVLDMGHLDFGENRVQEARNKWPDFKSRYDNINLHLIGPLQTNKARLAMEFADEIHSLDRLRLAETLARLSQELGSCPRLFIQVNTGEEEQKSGITPSKLESFVKECRRLDLPIYGLMCIPPVFEEPSLHFALLKNLAELNGLEGLSMGMSNDFEKAISLGATHVRVGSAIFGQRIG